MITLATLNSATAQEVFDQVTRHLLTQKAKSFISQESPTCLYRNKDGLKCAAGCLISDEEFEKLIKPNPDYNSKSWNDLISLLNLSYEHSTLITELQNVHDVNNVTFWLSNLEALAQEYNFSTTVLQEFN